MMANVTNVANVANVSNVANVANVSNVSNVSICSEIPPKWTHRTQWTLWVIPDFCKNIYLKTICYIEMEQWTQWTRS